MDSCREIDLHCLDLRYADARLADARAVQRLARSIEQCGQLVPCIVVAVADRLVVIDGYRRIAALRRLGRDTANVQPWICDLAQGLLNVLAQSQSRPFMAIEEALLLRELVHRLQLSQREVARRTGRDVSWVQRRLLLLMAMSDSLLDAVRCGRVSSWPASRILAPLSEQGYLGDDVEVLGVMEDTATRETARMLCELATGKAVAGGKVAEMLRERAAEIETHLAGRSDQEQIAEMEQLVRSTDVRVWSCDWG